MSFRLNDLKKSVRKTRDGHQITPYRLDGRAAAFKIEFLLQQFEGHLGCPRRLLDPDALLDFVGDARLGRSLLATLAQWYRMRPRTFAELLPDGGAALQERGIAGPVDLRAWLYTAANRASGYLDPAGEAPFWQAESRTLGIRREGLQKLMLLDRPEEAVLVRTGPSPTTDDVIAAYNARGHTTLLRSAAEVTLLTDSLPAARERAARVWAEPLGVEWQVEGETLRLLGRADAVGSWTRHGRNVERAALELLAMPDLAFRELRGQIMVGERRCRFCWKADTLALLGAGTGTAESATPEQVAAFATALRRERESGAEWGIRRAAHLVGVAGGVFLPHLELRHGDLSLYLRLAGPQTGAGAAARLAPFREKTPVALVTVSDTEEGLVMMQFAGDTLLCPPGTLLALLAEHVQPLRCALTAPAPMPPRTVKRAA